jgi:hypothetical protein
MRTTCPRRAAATHGDPDRRTKAVLRRLARHPDGCAEAELLADGLSIGQLTDLVIDGFAKMQPTVTALGECEKIVVWVLITAAGRKAIAG